MAGNERICPICGVNYTEAPAVSREDNYTLICPECGTRQALTALGVPKNEQTLIIELVKKYGRSGKGWKHDEKN